MAADCRRHLPWLAVHTLAAAHLANVSRMIRDLILTITILCIVYIAAHQPPPVKTVQVDYCVITFKAARPCSLLDRYENI